MPGHGQYRVLLALLCFQLASALSAGEPGASRRHLLADSLITVFDNTNQGRQDYRYIRTSPSAAEFTTPAAAGTYKLARVTLKLYTDAGNGLQSVTVGVAAWNSATAAGMTSSDLASVVAMGTTTQSVSVTDTPTLFSFDFSPALTLTSGTTYALLVSSTVATIKWGNTGAQVAGTDGWTATRRALYFDDGVLKINGFTTSWYKLELQAVANVNNDPILQGFDGKLFEFHQLGDFPLLSTGDGWKAEATFVPSVPQPGDEFLPEKQLSWTGSVRVRSPTGDVVSCSLPSIRPNTTRISMTATPAQSDSKGKPIHLSADFPAVELGDLKAIAEIGDGEEGKYVNACRLITPKWELRAYQFSGWEAIQQNLVNGHTKSVLYYTWLNTDFSVSKPLTAPVTGLIGDTYPASLAVPIGQDAWLGAMGDPEGEASVVGLPMSRKLLMADGEARKAVAEVQQAWERLPEGCLVAGTGMAA